MSLPQERMTEQRRRLHDDIYGLDQEALGGSGPSVVTVSSVLASLAAIEVTCLLTGLRPPALQHPTAATSEPWDHHVTRERRDRCPFCQRWRAASRHLAAG